MDPINSFNITSFFVPFGLILAAIGIVVLIVAYLLPKRSITYPYEKQATLFTPAEGNFLKALDQAVCTRLRVFGKVRVADIVKVKSMRDRAQWQRAFNKISNKHFDYILCAPYDLTVVCAVELDDASHGKRKRVERDHFLKGMCEAAELPLVRVVARRSYDPADIQAQILDALQWKR